MESNIISAKKHLSSMIKIVNEREKDDTRALSEQVLLFNVMTRLSYHGGYLAGAKIQKLFQNVEKNNG